MSARRPPTDCSLAERLRDRISHAFFWSVDALYYKWRRRPDYRAALGSALDGLPPGAWVLDFGCGDGAVATEIGRGRAVRMALADVDREALAKVPGPLWSRRVVLPSRPPLPFRDGAFGLILLIDVLHHVPRADETLAELARALAPGGTLYIVEFWRGHGLARVFEAAAWAFGRRCTFYRPEELKSRLARLGLEGRVEILDGLRYAARMRRP